MADGTAQKRQALAFAASALGKEDGAQYLVQYLKEKLGNQAPIDLMTMLVQYIYQVTRKMGESMVAYGNREHELHHKLQRAFVRVRGAVADAAEQKCLETELRGALLLYNSGLDSYLKGWRSLGERPQVFPTATHRSQAR